MNNMTDRSQIQNDSESINMMQFRKMREELKKMFAEENFDDDDSHNASYITHKSFHQNKTLGIFANRFTSHKPQIPNQLNSDSSSSEDYSHLDNN
jgi:hypothetical protein